MEREAARRISRAWLSFRDRQIFQILKSVMAVTNQGMDGMLLQRLSPNEAALFDPESIVLKMRLAGEQFPPKVVFKICLKEMGHTTDAYCYEMIPYAMRVCRVAQSQFI